MAGNARLWRLFSGLVGLWVLMTCAHSSEASRGRKTLPNLEAHRTFWSRGSRADPLDRVTFHVALHKQKSESELQQLVSQLSELNSPSYGHFLNAQQLQQVWQPKAHALQVVQNTLSSHAVNDTTVKPTALGDALVVQMTVQQAEQVFDTQLHQYEHRLLPALRVIRPMESYTIPREMEPFVLFIDGLESLPSPIQAQMMQQLHHTSKHKSHRTTPRQESRTTLLLDQLVATFATPDRIRQHYGVPKDVNAAVSNKNTIVIPAFLQETYSEEDLRSFYHTVEHKSLPDAKLPKHSDLCLSEDPTGEASLDTQVIVALTGSDSIQMLCYDHLRDPDSKFQDDNQEPFLEFLQQVNAMDPAPGVVSISYTDDECAVPVEYAQVVNHELMKAAMRGISVIISAGDSGVQGSHLAADFCKQPRCSRFEAMFPASSPFITSVGGTKLLLDQDQGDGNGKYKEVVVTTKLGSTITSGGGFSRLFEQPTYQRDAVDPYLALMNQKNLTSMFNAEGRAYPDLAAVGADFPVYVGGKLGSTDGTSVSAPVVASMVALINKQRLETGQPPLGFLNPLLYQMHKHCPFVFADVTEGDNACGSALMDCCPDGHCAAPGWDAITGLGTLAFDEFATNLETCLQQTRLAASSSPRTRGTRMEQTVTEAVYFSSLLAGIALCSALFTLRHKLFVGASTSNERYASCGFTRDSALEKLLGVEHQTA